jgi:hypothetical protein
MLSQMGHLYQFATPAVDGMAEALTVAGILWLPSWALVCLVQMLRGRRREDA